MFTDLYKFYKFTQSSKSKACLKAPHIKEVSKLLMRQARGDKEYKNLCISLAPRHGKSSLITIAYPIWLLLKNPNTNILIVTASYSLSENFGLEIRNLIRTYQEILPITLSEEKQTTTHLRFQDNNGNLTKGSIRLTSIGSQITGFNADVIILDDYIKDLQDLSPTNLDKQWNWFTTVLNQRREEHTTMTILGTRWSTDEIQGRIKANPDNNYRFTEFPCINEEGDVLWKEKFTKEYFNDIRSEMGERMFSALYLCKPLDTTGDFFSTNKIQFNLPRDYEPSETVRCYDLATEDETNETSDYTAGILASKSGKDFIVTDLIHGRFGENNINVIKETAIKDGRYTPIYIEFGTKMAANQLLPFYKKELPNNIVNPLIPLKSKPDRATPLRFAMEDGHVYINIHNTELRNKIIDELNSFPLGSNDDIVDALAHAYNSLFVTDKPSAKIGAIKLF